jgi:hypothetical protein
MFRIFIVFIICVAIFSYIYQPQIVAQIQTQSQSQSQLQSQSQTQTQTKAPTQISTPGLTSIQIQAHAQAQAQAQAQAPKPIPTNCSENIIYGPCKNMYGLEMNKENDCAGNITGIEKGVQKITYKDIPGLKCPEPSNIGCTLKCDVNCEYDKWKNVGPCKINKCDDIKGIGMQTQEINKILIQSQNEGDACVPSKEVPCTENKYIGCYQCGGENGYFVPGATCDNIKSCEDETGLGERIDIWTTNNFNILPNCTIPPNRKVPCRTAKWDNCICKNDMSDNSFCNETNTICKGASSECTVNYVHTEALPQKNGDPGICPEEKKNPIHKNVNLHKCTCIVQRNIGTWTYINRDCDINNYNNRYRSITITKKGGNRGCVFPQLSNNEKLVDTVDNKGKGIMNPNGQMRFGENNDVIGSTFKTIETENKISNPINPNCIL